jgi:hypothetical protein
MWAPYGHGSLWTHHVGTFNILEQWGEPADVCAAGLLHHAYESPEVGRATISERDRDGVRRAVGERAEELLFRWARMDAGLQSALVHDDEQVLERVIRRPSEDGVALETMRHIFVIGAAHQAERSCSANGFPTMWLSAVSRVASRLRHYGASLPEALSLSADHFNEAAEARLINAYEAAANATVDDLAASAELRIASDAAPMIAEPLVLLALRATRRREWATASSMAHRAADAMLLWNTAWDKRLSVSQWLEVAELLAGLTDCDEDYAHFIASLVDTVMCTPLYPETLYCRLDALGAFASPPEPAPPLEAEITSSTSDLTDAEFEELPPRFSEFMCGLRESDPVLSSYPDLEERPWWDTSAFSLPAVLESRAAVVGGEYLAVPLSSYDETSELMLPTPGVRVCVLASNGRGYRHDLAPQTLETLDPHRVMRGPHGVAAFVRIAGQTTTPVQHGPTNLRIRCVFGLHDTEGAELIVNGITKALKVGRCLTFDDSFPYELANRGDRECGLFVVDLWHPQLTEDEIRLLEGMQQYIAREHERLNSSRVDS